MSRTAACGDTWCRHLYHQEIEIQDMLGMRRIKNINNDEIQINFQQLGGHIVIAQRFLLVIKTDIRIYY